MNRYNTDMISITLTPEEAEYLQDILSMWIEGYEDATQAVVDDEVLLENHGVEQWLSAVDGMREHRTSAEDIVRKLKVGRAHAAA